MSRNSISDIKAPLQIALVGPTPPIVGGVSTSIGNILESLRGNEKLQAKVYGSYDIWRLLIELPDIVHFNFSRSKKRLVGTLLARMLGIKVIHTIHGNQFDFARLDNVWSTKLSHGFILINSDIYRRFASRNVPNIVLFTPIIKNSQRSGKSNIPKHLQRKIDRIEGKLAVVYAYSRQNIDGAEIYGFGFISSLLPRIKELGYTVLFLDPSACYQSENLDPCSSGNFIHCTEAVDFKALLRRASVYLRPTATDGNSVAVLEALEANVPVLASDVVPRPVGVTTYRADDNASFLASLASLRNGETSPTRALLTTPTEYVDFVRGICSSEKA